MLIKGGGLYSNFSQRVCAQASKMNNNGKIHLETIHCVVVLEQDTFILA